MSYNNFTDADAAWRAAFDHEQTCVAIIKHANPCGIAISSVSVADAHRKAHECDPLSAYGGVIAANTEVSLEMAEYVSTIFTEVIVAPAYAPGAVDALTRKKNIRVLVASEPLAGGTELRPVSGGLLVQSADRISEPGDEPGGDAPREHGDRDRPGQESGAGLDRAVVANVLEIEASEEER